MQFPQSLDVFIGTFVVTFINSCFKTEPLFLARPDGRLQDQGRRLLRRWLSVELQSRAGLLDLFSSSFCSHVTDSLSFVRWAFLLCG